MVLNQNKRSLVLNVAALEEAHHMDLMQLCISGFPFRKTKRDMNEWAATLAFLFIVWIIRTSEIHLPPSPGLPSDSSQGQPEKRESVWLRLCLDVWSYR